MHPKTRQLLLFLAALAAGEAAATTLTATPEKLAQSDLEITIRWSDLPAPDALDYVAIYSPSSSRDLDFLSYLFLNGSASWPNGRGELTLPRLPNLRAPYQFRLFRWPAKEYSYHHVDHDGNPLPHGRHRVAVSGDVAFADSARPEQVHLAFADRVDEMRVLFVCGDGGKRVVRYGLQKEEEKGWREVATEVRTYEQKHMCDWPANDGVAWRDPGFVFDGLMKGLEPGRRYFYKVDVVEPSRRAAAFGFMTGIYSASHTLGLGECLFTVSARAVDFSGLSFLDLFCPLHEDISSRDGSKRSCTMSAHVVVFFGCQLNTTAVGVHQGKH